MISINYIYFGFIVMTIRHPREFSYENTSLKDIYRAIEETEERIKVESIAICILLIIIIIML